MATPRNRQGKIDMNHVAIVDYRLCNLGSIYRAIEQCGGTPYIARSPGDLYVCDRIILPGVGSFARAIQNLHEMGFAETISELVGVKKTPLLGICLGMQLLAEQGTEGGNVAGLGLLRGRVTRLESQIEGRERIPHIGWNDVTPVGNSSIFDGIDAGTNFYFVHSYRLDSPAEEVLGTVNYCGRTVAAAARNNVMAVQFHPEKSQAAGLRLLRNFLAL